EYEENKYRYHFFINGVKSEENTFGYYFRTGREYPAGLQDILEITLVNDRIYFSNSVIALGTGYGNPHDGYTEPLSKFGLDYDVPPDAPPIVEDVSGYLGDDNIIDNPDITL